MSDITLKDQLEREIRLFWCRFYPFRNMTSMDLPKELPRDFKDLLDETVKVTHYSCDWEKACNGHFNISCQSGPVCEQALDIFHTRYKFKHCPFCGGQVKIVRTIETFRREL